MKRLFFLVCSLILVYFGFIAMAKKSLKKRESLIITQQHELNKAYPEMIITHSLNSITMQVDENSIYFDLDSYILNDKAKEKLLPLISILDKRNIVTISGHTCDLGDDNYNLKLSEKRAEQVKDFIQYKKPSINNVYAFGYGQKFPVASNSDGGRRLNRRVEVKIEIEDGHDEEPSSTGIPTASATRKPNPEPEEGNNTSNDDTAPIEIIKSTNLNTLFEKYNWAILGIGLVGTLFSIVEIIRKWNK